MFKKYRSVIVLALILSGVHAAAQDVPAKPTEHVVGTIARADPAAHTITVKDDRTGSETTILLADTKTFIKVPPGAKDLKTATRITADDLMTGDRVDVRGSKPSTDPEKITARSVVLMSGRELQAVHQAQAAEWQSATAGVVTAVDAAGQKITIRQRAAGAPPLVVAVTRQTEFTRYAPETPTAPVASSLGQIQPGDQVKVIGETAADGSAMAAKRIYSGAFRTLTGTVLSIGADGKQLVIKDLASNKPVNILLNESSSVRKMPPEMAARLAQRAAGGPGGGASGPGGGSEPSGPAGADIGRPGMGGPGMGGRRRDMSRMIERLPTISLGDLKPGDAVVVAGAATGADGSRLVATNVIAGVEALLRSAPAGQRSGQSLGGDWGLGEMSVPQ